MATAPHVARLVPPLLCISGLLPCPVLLFVPVLPPLMLVRLVVAFPLHVAIWVCCVLLLVLQDMSVPVAGTR